MSLACLHPPRLVCSMRRCSDGFSCALILVPEVHGNPARLVDVVLDCAVFRQKGLVEVAEPRHLIVLRVS